MAIVILCHTISTTFIIGKITDKLVDNAETSADDTLVMLNIMSVHLIS